MDCVVASCMAMAMVGDGGDTSCGDGDALLEVVEVFMGISLLKG